MATNYAREGEPIASTTITATTVDAENFGSSSAPSAFGDVSQVATLKGSRLQLTANTLGISLTVAAGERLQPSASSVTQETSINTGVTANGVCGVITTVVAGTAGLDNDIFVVSNDRVAGSGQPILVCLNEYVGAGEPVVMTEAVTTGQFTIKILNTHASTVLNAALKISYLVL